MKNCLITLICSCLSLGLIAQVEVSGQLFDQNNEPLPGAHISLMHPWGEVLKATSSESNGRFKLKGIPRGGYKVRISFIGYSDYMGEVSVKDQNVNIGRIRLSDQTVELEGVEVKDKLPLATQQGDTTQYNADAFKTLSDASAEELIEKMPGVVVESGKVQAQGEDVKEVLVDGQPFFGSDPMAALRNLPAEVIDKIQVFDRASDQSTFTGFNDGETTKTINIITKTNRRNGQFGKVHGAYGTDERYSGGGNLSLFNGKQRISIIGQSNNVNQQNFSTEDLLGVVGSSGNSRRGFGRRGGRRGRQSSGTSVNDFLVEQQGGVARTHAFGLNYSDRWGSKTNLSGSYFFNQSKNESLEDLNQAFVSTEGSDEVYTENNQSIATNSNHRLNLRIEHRLDSANSIIFTPRMSIQLNDGRSNTQGSWLANEQLLSQTSNLYQSDLSALNFSGNLLFRHRFAKNRRTLSISLGSGLNSKDGDSQLRSESQFFTHSPDSDTLDQLAVLDNSGWNFSSNISYTEPIGQRSMLMLNYRFSQQRDRSDQETFDFSEDAEGYSDLNIPLSNLYESDFTTQRLGVSFNFRQRSLVIMTRANVQWSQLRSDQKFPTAFDFRQTYINFLPFAMLRYNFSRKENIRIVYRSSVSQPSIEQLQEILDNSNPLQLSIGNSQLNPAVQHRLFSRYSRNNPDKATVFYLLLSASYTSDYLTSNTFLQETDNPIFDNLQLEPGTQLTQSINTDGYWNLRFYTTYGFPLKRLKSNLNIDLSTTYTRNPGKVNDVLNYSNNSNIKGGLVLSSNISEKLDFTLSWRPAFNLVKNSLLSESDNRYFSQNSRIKLGWVLGPGIVWRTNLTHQYYDGLSEGFDQNYWLWNMSIGKKLFKNELGEIAISVFDLLNQNNSISRNINEIYIEDIRTNVLQRYFMLTFTYNFRNFNIGKKPYEEPKRDDRPFFMR
ncbi:MAG: TonB-dependent receptor [Bacteroidota bacterium]